MTKHAKNCRAIAAAIVALVAATLLFVSHSKEQASKQDFLAHESRRYDLFIQHPSFFRDLRAAILNVGTTVIVYELLSMLLIKVLPPTPREESEPI